MDISWPETSGAVVLEDDELHVWAVRLNATRARWDELLVILSPDERRRAEQFRVEAPRRRFVVARAALRTLLGSYLSMRPEAVTLCADAGGKPRLSDELQTADLRFNVAHSGDLAVVAMTIGCDVGVDVERLRKVDHAEHIATRYFHPAETEAILTVATAARDAAFLRCWTGKEAVLKAVGSGITGSLAAMRIPIAENSGAWIDIGALSKNPPLQCWLEWLVPCPEYMAAVACVAEARGVRCFCLSI